ncbi:hypothetical protein [Ureibacillus sp. FSL K6-3587]|uniref:hypothetical protein n=1 Tax=Ureibacillus sp. FSL K6-3587 TaxID=2954681 RepID=UPI003158C80C
MSHELKKLIEETQQSYYEYVAKIPDGCQLIASCLQSGELDQAFSMIADFGEGLEWLLAVETYMLSYHYQIHSRIEEAVELLNEVNAALEKQDIPVLTRLFDPQLASIFNSASEWIFERVEH